jgi:D-alanyl-D-alanine carboxypeptidase
MMRLCCCVLVCVAVALMSAIGRTQQANTASSQDRVAALLRAYPDFLDRIEQNQLIWKDGSKMPIDDGKGSKSFDALLDDPDIKDMFSMSYPLGEKGIPPGVNFDPGRVRYMPLFQKMYGDCEKRGFMANAGDVVWLSSKPGHKTIKFSKINGAAKALQQVSDELDKLPGHFTQYLQPTEGTYNCRVIAGTKRQSAHGLGVAIDIASAHTNYWLWTKPAPNAAIPYKNQIPWDIVNIFERYGFIWGGKWYHYDTMHFEYRPEIIEAAKNIH